MSEKISRQEKRIAAAEEGERIWKERSGQFRGISDQMKAELFDQETGAYKGTRPLRVKDMVEVEELAHRLDGQQDSKIEINFGNLSDAELERRVEVTLCHLLGIEGLPCPPQYLSRYLVIEGQILPENMRKGDAGRPKELPEAGQEVEGKEME